MQYLSVTAIILVLSVQFIVEAVVSDGKHKATNEDGPCSNGLNMPENGAAVNLSSKDDLYNNGTLESYICLVHHSNNHFINISTDLTLSSITSLSGLYNITISGHKILQ